jgi:adenine-specific DNA-methyltransferase
MKEGLPLLRLAGVAPGRTPPTRYQGSKYKLLDWIWENMRCLEFDSVLDAFGGSACVSHHLKGEGKAVTYNDILISNYLCGVGLIENDDQVLTAADIQFVLRTHNNVEYDDFIARTFHDVYFTDEENSWLDVVAQNIPLLTNRFKQALAWYALFQSAISKRPYNLFHRKNLYVRTADVARTFGNKATWDKAFDVHFRSFAGQANDAVFSNGRVCRALNCDATQAESIYDLVYIDPPYMSGRGVGVDYHHFYHFLEGLADYRNWHSRVDFRTRHLRLKQQDSAWISRKRVPLIFEQVLRHFSDSTIVVSYRSDGIPSPKELVDMVGRVKKHVETRTLASNYKYVLSKNDASTEMLIIGRD